MTCWYRVHRNSRLEQSRTSASAGIATPYASSTTFRAALPSGVPTAPRRAHIVFAHAMSWTSVSTSSSGSTCFTTTSSGIGARRRGSACSWLSSASGGAGRFAGLAFDRAGRFAAGLAPFGFLAAGFSARRAGFAGRRDGFAALDLAAFFVRGGIVSAGTGRADIACERN